MDRKLLFTLGGTLVSGNDDTGSDIQDAGVVTVAVTENTVEAAYDRITTAIQENENLALIAELDHRENAGSVDMELPPTRVIFFGNPEAGTPLMQDSQRVGLDLPQRMLIWEDNGDVKVTYNDPKHVAARHGIDGKDELLENIADLLDAIATGSM